MTDERGATNEFVAIIRSAVAADPTNLGLRIDLVELLLEHDVDSADPEIAALDQYGANPQTVAVLRARAAAARLRRRANTGGLGDATPPSAASASPEAAPAATDFPTMPSLPPLPPVKSPEARLSDDSLAWPPAGEPPPAQTHDPRIRMGVGDEDERQFFDVDRPAVRLDDVAGMFEVKRHLETTFLAPMRNPELARMYGQASRGSLLMYGPPGCGKTFIARAIAGELGANFIHVTVADIMGQFWGQTEKAIHDVFEAARAARPCVIFFDEFDAVGGRRTSGGSNSQQLRMLTSQLLVELDGVEASNDGIYLLAATNRPWDIDPALRRPGRLDRTVLILPPDEVARAAIVHSRLKDKPAANVDLNEIVRRTDEFSGADLSYLVDTAVQHAFMESMRDGVPRMIGTPDLVRATGSVTPSTRGWFAEIKPVLEYGTDDGTFAQLRSYLKQHRI